MNNVFLGVENSTKKFAEKVDWENGRCFRIGLKSLVRHQKTIYGNSGL